MASFPPFKEYIRRRTDELILRYGACPPFLDIGCGTGEDAVHFAEKWGWHGTGIDPAYDSSGNNLISKDNTERLSFEKSCLEEYRGGFFRTIFMFDVLEHIHDDERAMHIAGGMQIEQGLLFMTIPSNPQSEYRKDDCIYGHFRRYNPGGIAALLDRAGYEILECSDLSFPVFWAMRRIYTGLPSVGLFGPELSEPDDIPAYFTGLSEQNIIKLQQRSRDSATAKAWNIFPGILSIAGKLPWKIVFKIQDSFGFSSGPGCEMLILARKKGGTKNPSKP